MKIYAPLLSVLICFNFSASPTLAALPDSCKETSEIIANTIIESTGEQTVCKECGYHETAEGSERWWGKCEWDKGSRVELNFSSTEEDPFDPNKFRPKTEKDIQNGALFDFTQSPSAAKNRLLRHGSLKCKTSDNLKPSYLNFYASDAWNTGKIPAGHLENVLNQLYINLYNKGVCTPFPGHSTDTGFSFTNAVHQSAKKDPAPVNPVSRNNIEPFSLNRLIDFKDNDSKVTFKYPDIFYFNHEPDDNYNFFPRDADEKKSTIVWYVHTRSFATGGRDEAKSSDLIKMFARNYAGMPKNEIIEQKEVQFGGLTGSQIIYTLPKYQRYYIRTILDAGDHFYYLHLMTNMDDKNRYTPVYQLMLDTITPPPGVVSKYQSASAENTKPVISNNIIQPVTPPEPRQVNPPPPPESLTPPEPEQKQTSTPKGMTLFEDKPNHASFHRPEEMRYEKKEAKHRFINDGGTAYITYEPMAYENDGGNYTDTYTMCQYLIAEMQKHFDAKLIGKIEKVSSGGLSGHKIHFSWKMESQPLEQIEYALDGPDKIYSFGLLATPKSFSAYQSKFNQMINSFSLEKQTAAKPAKPPRDSKDNASKDSVSKDKKKDESLTLYVDSGPIKGKLGSEPIAVIFVTEESGPHTVRCNSMNDAPVMMILYDGDGKKIDSNFKDKQLYKGFRNTLEGKKSYFFFVAPLKDEDHGKTFEVEVVSE